MSETLQQALTVVIASYFCCSEGGKTMTYSRRKVFVTLFCHIRTQDADIVFGDKNR